MSVLMAVFAALPPELPHPLRRLRSPPASESAHGEHEVRHCGVGTDTALQAIVEVRHALIAVGCMRAKTEPTNKNGYSGCGSKLCGPWLDAARLRFSSPPPSCVQMGSIV